MNRSDSQSSISERQVGAWSFTNCYIIFTVSDSMSSLMMGQSRSLIMGRAEAS